MTLEQRFNAKFKPNQNRVIAILEGQRTTLPLPIIEGAHGIKIPREDFELLLACARYELPPPFTAKGRSALVERLTALQDKRNDRELAAYKIKGCGARLENGQVMVPATIPYRSEGVITHMGFTNDGSLIAVPDPPKPYGGLKAGRGQREFENAKRLFNAGVLAVTPIYWGKYPTLLFEGSPMEFVILGMEEAAKKRVGNYFEYVRFDRESTPISPDLLEIANRKFECLDTKAQAIGATRVLYEIMRKFGEALAKFHTDGETIRFAGHDGNYSYDTTKSRVILHDLDSSVHISEVDPKIIGLSKVRDIESAIFGIFELYWVSGLEEIISRDNRRKFDFFRAFLEGYFGDRKDQLKVASQSLQDNLDRSFDGRRYCRTTLDLMKWMSNNHQVLAVPIMHAIMPIYEESEQGRKHILLYGASEFERRYPAFVLDSRKEYERYCKEQGVEPM